MNILFVCTGNTCRSPMAEELLRCMAKELQIDDLEVSSAGTDADAGLPRRSARAWSSRNEAATFSTTPPCS